MDKALATKLQLTAPWLIVLAAFIARLFCIGSADIVDADAVSRIFIAEQWISDPKWFYEGVWAPFHFYFTAFAIVIFEDRVLGPMYLTALFGALTAFPIYRFTQLVFNSKVAVLCSVFFVFSPLVFRNSLQPLAGVPYAFFAAMSMWLLAESLSEKSTKPVIPLLFSGLMITIAAGMRYEAWLLIAVFSLVIFLYRKWKLLPVFWSTAMIFPLLWMVGNYIQHGNILYSVDYATYFNTVRAGVNEELSSLTQLKRLVFFPQSLALLLPFGLAVPLFGMFFYKAIKEKISKNTLIWAVPFFIVLGVYIFKAFEGTLLLKQRFSISLLLLLVPIIGSVCKEFSKSTVAGLIGVSLMFPLLFNSFFIKATPYVEHLIPNDFLRTALSENRYETQEFMKPVPRLVDNKVEVLLDKTNRYLTPNTPLVLDFFGWAESYNYALMSGVKSKAIYFLFFKIMNEKPSFDGLHGFYDGAIADKGVMVLRKGSKNMKNVVFEKNTTYIFVQDKKVPITLLESFDVFRVFEFDTRIFQQKKSGL